MPLTPEEFVGFDGAACPACGGEVCNIPSECAVLAGVVEDTPGLLLKARCVDCHSTWTETFRLTGYTGLELSAQHGTVIHEIIPKAAAERILDLRNKRGEPSELTTGEWLSEIEELADERLRSICGNEVPATSIDADIQFIHECLAAIAFLRKAGVVTQEVDTRVGASLHDDTQGDSPCPQPTP